MIVSGSTSNRSEGQADKISCFAIFFFYPQNSQLQKLKVEPVLLHYLSHIRALQGQHPSALTDIKWPQITATAILLNSVSSGRHGRPGAEDDHEHQTEGVLVQLHITWWPNVSHKSRSARSLGCTELALSCEYMDPGFLRIYLFSS